MIRSYWRFKNGSALTFHREKTVTLVEVGFLRCTRIGEEALDKSLCLPERLWLSCNGREYAFKIALFYMTTNRNVVENKKSH